MQLETSALSKQSQDSSFRGGTASLVQPPADLNDSGSSLTKMGKQVALHVPTEISSGLPSAQDESMYFGGSLTEGKSPETADVLPREEGFAVGRSRPICLLVSAGRHGASEPPWKFSVENLAMIDNSSADTAQNAHGSQLDKEVENAKVQIRCKTGLRKHSSAKKPVSLESNEENTTQPSSDLKESSGEENADAGLASQNEQIPVA